jgi:hypothetical protein
VIDMSEADREAYRAFVQTERASQMDARARAGLEALHPGSTRSGATGV